MAVQRDPGTYSAPKPKKKRKPAPAPPVSVNAQVALSPTRAKTTKAEITAAATGKSVAEVRAARKEGKKALKRAAKATTLRPRASEASAASAVNRIFGDDTEKAYFVSRGKRGNIRKSTFEDRPTPEEAVFHAFTGINADEPSKTKASDVAIAGATIGLPAAKLRAAGKLLGRAEDTVSGAAKAERRAAARSAGQKVKPVARAKAPGSRKAAKQARRKRAPGEYRKRTRVPRSKQELKARTKRQIKKRKPVKPGQGTLRHRTAGSVAHSVTALGPVAAIPGGVAVATAEALKEDPIGTLKTTARTLPGLAAGVIGTAKDVGTTAKRTVGKAFGSGQSWEDVLDPVEKEGKLQLAYLKGIAELDAEDVKERYGLIPAATGALGALSLAKVRGRAPKTPGPTRAQRKGQAEMESGDRTTAARGEARIQKANEKGAGYVEGHHGRKRGAQRADVAGERERGIGIAEMRQANPRRRGRRKRVDKQIEELARREVRDGVTEADVLQVLGRMGANLDNHAQTLARLRNKRANLEESSREFGYTRLHTRRVLDALIADQGRVFESQLLRDTLGNQGDQRMGLAALQHERQVEDHLLRLGREGADPERERARLQDVRQEHGILGDEERIPAELRAATSVQAALGQEARPALRKEARDDRRQAKALKRRARQEQAKARGAARELNVRRVADDRRTVIRGRNQKIRNIEKRLAAWEAKARKARKPETKARYEAKIAQLRRQLRDTRATVAMAASPARLRVVRRITEHKGHESQLRNEADSLVERALVKEAYYGRFARAEGLERKADAAGSHAEAAELRTRAAALRAEAIASSDTLRDETIEEVLSTIERQGYRQPINFKQSDVTRPVSSPAQPASFGGARVPAAERLRKGTLAMQGRIDESGEALLQNLYDNRRKREHNRMWEQLVRQDRYVHEGRSVFSSLEADGLQARGHVPPGYTRVPLQQFERLFKRGKWEEAAGMFDDAFRREIRDSRRQLKGQGNRYVYLPEAEVKEMKLQMESPGRGLRTARVLGAAQSVALIGTSPKWFSFQLVASPFTALVSHPNPVRWLRVATKGLREYNKLTLKQKAAFRAEFGGTTSDALMKRKTGTSLEPGTALNMYEALQGARKTPLNRALRGFKENVKRGGPLIQGNREYESWVRLMTGLMEHDKIVHPPYARRFLNNLSKLEDTTHRHLSVVSRLPHDQQLLYYDRHPEAAHELAQRIRETLGDWSSITSAERLPAAVSVFYPFLRFSLKWAFVSMPRRHPLKMAILLNLSQQNAQELEELLGADPTFVSKYGIAVTHTGPDGEAIKGFDTSRFNPAGNVVSEIGASGNLNLATALRPAQPLIGIAAALLGSYDPYTGEHTDEPADKVAIRQGLSLSPWTRPLIDELGVKDPSDVARLFSESIYGKEGNLEEQLNPLSSFKVDLIREEQAAGVGQVLEKSKGPDIPKVISEQIEPAVKAGGNPKKIGRQIGKATAKAELESQEWADLFAQIMKQEGYDDPEMEIALDEFFSQVTPAQFGNASAKGSYGKPSAGGWYDDDEDSGGGGGKSKGGWYD